MRWASLIAGALFWTGLDKACAWGGAGAVGYGLQLVAHGALATRALPPTRRWLRAVATGLLAGALSIGARWIVAGVPTLDGWMLLAGGPTLAWWMLFPLAGAALASGNTSGGRARRWASAIAVVASLYVATFVLVFDVRGGEPHPYVEHPDAAGRSPVVGPKVSWVGNALCPGTGPCFLWSCDHIGDEWIFRFWKPLVGAWFRANSGRFHNPDHPDPD
jgi:hypothetical protein